jgi:hypothetical protein
MKNLNVIAHVAFRYVTLALALAMPSAGAWAQDSTTKSVKHGTPSLSAEVRNAEIVYVQGNNLVLRLENGRVEHLVVPDSDRFIVSGKEVSVYDLKPGTKLTQTITTTTTPRYVNTVRTIKGKIWHTTPTGRVIVTLPDGTNQVYQVPNHAKVVVNGKQVASSALRKGMLFEATIVTDSPEIVHERTKLAVGEEPAPATPQLVGFLVVQQPQLPAAPTAAPVEVASAEELAPTLPKTATLQPLAGVLGVLGVAAAVGLGVVRKRFTV